MQIAEQIGVRPAADKFIFDRNGGELIYELSPQPESKYFSFDFSNLMDFAARLEIHFYKQADFEKPNFSITTGVLPQLSTKVEISLSYLDGQQLFGERRPGILKTVINGTRMKLSDIHFVGIHMAKSHVETSLKISNPAFLTQSEETPIKEKLIDEFGQRADKSWSGKTESWEEIGHYLNVELEKAKNFLAEAGTNFGGSGEAIYEATGYYRLEKEIIPADNFNPEKVNWQMISPDGKSFWGFGCDVVQPEITGETEAEEYALSNLSKIWGDKAYENWKILTAYRLKKWGINSIAAWSDLDFAQEYKIPYVTIFETYPDSKAKIYRDFPDVFSNEFKESAKNYGKELESFKDDPYLIGYFMSNEPNWAFAWGLNLGYETFIGFENLASKAALVKWLSERFGRITELNKEFETDFPSFESILQASNTIKISEKGLKVLKEFQKVLIHEFIKIPAEALKSVDNKHLNLGIRYAFISDDSLYEGAEYLDIFSINSYDNSPVRNIEKVFKHTAKPIMIGEFHFGALDRGLPATGIRGVRDQKNRGKAISYYLTAAKETGHCVGAHYFQLNDQPYLGRFDGENYNIGLVDICNREYKEVTDEMQPINRIPEIFF